MIVVSDRTVPHVEFRLDVELILLEGLAVPLWSWPSSARRLRLSLLPALSVRGRPPTGRPPPAGGNGSTTQDRESISLPVALIPARGFSHKTRLSRAPFRLDPYTREVDWARPGRRGRRRVGPRTPHPAGDQGRHKQMIDPVAEPGQAAHALLRRSTRPTAWNPTTLAASAPARTFCAMSTRSSIEMERGATTPAETIAKFVAPRYALPGGSDVADGDDQG